MIIEQGIFAFTNDKPLTNAESYSLSLPQSFAVITSLLDKYLYNLPATSAKKMSERLVKKLKINSSDEYKDKAQQIIHCYLNKCALEPGVKRSLQLLESEFKTLSLYEIRSKYEIVLKHAVLEEADPLFLHVLRQLYTQESDAIIQLESQNLEESLLSQFDWAPVYRDEMLRLLVQAQQDEWQQRGIAFNCYVVDYRDLPFFLQLAEQQAAKQEDSDLRVLILVRNEVHYTALDCHFQKNQKSCFILDASQDPKHHILDAQLKDAGYRVAIAGASESDKIQLDSRSCSIFSFDHLSETGSKTHCFEEIIQSSQFDSKTRRISWLALKPNLVKNCQSLEFLQNYQTSHQIPLPIQINPNRNETEKNLGIEQRLALYQKTALAILKNKSPKDAAQIARTHPFKAISTILCKPTHSH